MSEAPSVLETMENTTVTPPVTPESEATPSTEPQDQAWYGDLSDDTLKDWIKNKAYSTPNEAIKAHHHLEKFLGADKAGRGVVVPKDDSPSEEWDSFYNKIGRPENAEGYELPVPEGSGKDFAEAMSKMMYESGIPKQAAHNLAKAWNEYQDQMLQQSNEQKESLELQQEANLKKEWGAAYEANVAQAKIAARAFGLTGEQVQALQDTLGFDGTFKFIYDLGSKTGEDKFIGGAYSKDNSQDAYSPADAEKEWSRLMSDKDFVNKIFAGDPKAMAIKSNLAKYRNNA